MRRKGSYIAGQIIRDYKLKKEFKKKARTNCKEKKCEECKYERNCTESERKDN